MRIRLLCFTLLVALARAQEDAAPLMARIEAKQSSDREGLGQLTVDELMQRFHVPGMTVAVIHDFQIHWIKAYGVADVQTGRKVTRDTAFQAASISKPVAAMAALHLAQEGKLSLDADINGVLKSWKVPQAGVTARSLFSHTSGADDGFGFPGYDPAAPRPTAVQVLNGGPPSNVGPVKFVRPPFQAQKYSGGGLTVMQVALSDLVGKPFAELMQTQVLVPLGMTGSSYEQPPSASMTARAARAHNNNGSPMGAPFHVYPEQAAAGLWTTAGDLARFLIEIQTAVRGPAGKLLKQPAAREMVTPTGVGPFAVGMRVDKRGEGWYISHGGSNWGFRADILAHIRKGYGVVVLTNGDAGTSVISEIEARVAAAYGWDSLDKPLPR
jgi:CubicO group peptidase (beta-lactamase class C family)